MKSLLSSLVNLFERQEDKDVPRPHPSPGLGCPPLCARGGVGDRRTSLGDCAPVQWGGRRAAKCCLIAILIRNIIQLFPLVSAQADGLHSG